MPEKNPNPSKFSDDILLRLGTARSSDTPGEGVLPVTTNLTAGEEVIEPEEERNSDFDSGA